MSPRLCFEEGSPHASVGVIQRKGAERLEKLLGADVVVPRSLARQFAVLAFQGVQHAVLRANNGLDQADLGTRQFFARQRLLQASECSAIKAVIWFAPVVRLEDGVIAQSSHTGIQSDAQGCLVLGGSSGMKLDSGIYEASRNEDDESMRMIARRVASKHFFW